MSSKLGMPTTEADALLKHLMLRHIAELENEIMNVFAELSLSVPNDLCVLRDSVKMLQSKIEELDACRKAYDKPFPKLITKGITA